MHVIFGGAFNGKRAYVEQLVEDKEAQWLDATEEFPTVSSQVEVVIVFGVEHVLEDKLNKLFEHLEQWDQNFEVIVIATEIGRGIVPMEASMRKLRDDVGRFYQQLFTRAERVTRIWYGISQMIKGR